MYGIYADGVIYARAVQKRHRKKAFAKSSPHRLQLALGPRVITVPFPDLTAAAKSARVAHKCGM
jgi:hypothetical protein